MVCYVAWTLVFFPINSGWPRKPVALSIEQLNLFFRGKYQLTHNPSICY